MFCVGLTGNIGSGKSTAMRFFESLGITVISADKVAREITAPGEQALEAIKDHFGSAIIQNNGFLNRKALRKIIFSDSKERRWLENHLHPLIRQKIEAQISKAQGAYVVVEIPLLLNREHYPYLDKILVILAGEENSIHRIMKRDQHSREEALSILSTQPEEAARRAIADDVIVNNRTLTDFEKAVKQIHQQYLLLANKAS